MEEDYKYLNIKEDRFLIDKIPNEYDMAKFEEWKDIEKKDIIESCIVSSIFLGFGLVLVVLGFFNMGGIERIYQILLMIMFLIMFLMIFLIPQIEEYSKLKSLKVDYCKYGKVIDKYTRRGNRHGRDEILCNCFN